jgi:YD repeat-containing protein
MCWGNLTQVVQPGTVTSTLTYDLGGRKRSMSDPDLGTWEYDYNRQGQLAYQTDGCGNVLAMSYDRLGRRLVQETATPGSGCPDSRLTTAATTTSYLYENGSGPNGHSRGQLTQVSYADNSYSKQWFYNGKGQLASETLWIGGAPQLYTTAYTYDGYDRPQTTTYPDGDVVTTTGYDSGSRPTGLTTSLWGQTQTLVDSARYDQAGRLVQLRYLYANGTWVSHYYRAWLGSDGNSNGRYWGMNVGSAPGGTNIFTTWYGYDTYGNPVGYATSEGGQLKDNTTFSYDVQNRVRSGYGESFTWQSRGAIASVNGITFTYDLTHTHAVDLVNNVDRYDYDLNGGMTVRNKGTAGQQTLKWDSYARLAQVVGAGVNESYLYDETGQRVRKTNNLTGVSTFYLVGSYEQTSGAVTKHYLWRAFRRRARTQRRPLLPAPGPDQQHGLRPRCLRQ